MPIVLELSDEELHNLANWVQVEMWRIEAGHEKRHGMLVIREYCKYWHDKIQKGGIENRK